MCGRYVMTVALEDVQELLPGFEVQADLSPRYNAAPTQELPIGLVRDGRKLVVAAKWGLVPRWAKDASIGSKLINARSETVHEKPSFRDAFRRRRCVVPASGFYEWRKEAGPSGVRSRPFLIRRDDGSPLAFAGLWETWGPPEAPLVSFTIVTTQAHPCVADVHDRMPVILPSQARAAWLDPETPAAELSPLLAPAGGLVPVEVSTRVNNARHDAPDCVVPAALQQPSSDTTT